MDYSKFYTPPAIASLLVGQLDIEAPESIIDICCGSCNLLHAAKKKWSKAIFVGVDIIKHSYPDICCIQSDGREYALEHGEQYALVLANPPFSYVEIKREFPKLYKDVSFKYSTSRLEIEMLLANLHLLKKQGMLMIIMPSTFVEAESSRKIREFLASKYHIAKIIRLPVETFGLAKINSYALFIKKEFTKKSSTEFCFIDLENEKFTIRKKTILSQEHVYKGKWDLTSYPIKLKSSFDFKRGKISSQLFKSSGIPVLHTAKYQDAWEPSIRYVSEIPEQAAYVENGDVIVSRVGKSAGQWTVHKGEKTFITDCLFRIKDPQGVIVPKLKGKKYSYAIKGVATQYITMQDFFTWFESLSN